MRWEWALPVFGFALGFRKASFTQVVQVVYTLAPECLNREYFKAI